MCLRRHCQDRTNNSSYPRSILPEVGFVVKIVIDDLLDKVNLFVLSRRLPGRLEDNIVIFGGKKRVRIASLGKIPNWSLNLLGGKFLEKAHTKFRQFDEAASDWDGKPVILENYIDKCEVIKDSSSIDYLGRDIHNISVPYVKEVKDKDEKKRLREAGVRIEDFTSVNLSAEIRLEHKPSMMNYWHVVMDIYPQESDTPIKDANSTWKQCLVDYIIQEILSVKFIVNPRTIPVIPESFYKKGE